MALVPFSDLPHILEIPQTETGFFTTFRQTALATVKSIGLPTSRQDQWRYVHLEDLYAFQIQWPLIGFREAGGSFSDICNSPELMAYLTTAIHTNQDPFYLLNAATFQSIVLLLIQQDQEKSISISGDSSSLYQSQKSIVWVSEGVTATLSIDLRSMSQSDYLANHALDIILEKGAVCQLTILQDGSLLGYNLLTVQVTQKENSDLKITYKTQGSKKRRTFTRIDFMEPGASCDIRSLTIADHNEIYDAIYVAHRVENCRSNQLYKTIVKDAALTEFNGFVLVSKFAQNTVAHQKNQNLLLSDTAKAYTRPQLKIFANEVECTHGATVGQLDEEQLFYLLTRGLSMIQAKAALVDAFAQEI